jgi:hypothetical protein
VKTIDRPAESEAVSNLKQPEYTEGPKPLENFEEVCSDFVTKNKVVIKEGMESWDSA